MKKTCSTIDRYLLQIRKATQTNGIYAYRGQSNAQFLLHSGATRRLIDEHGDDIVQDPEFPDLYINYHREVLIEPARTAGFGFESSRRLSDLELLAKLQHFGAATGLLDFTWSPLVALWFACENPCYDGKVFVVNTNDAIRVARVSSDDNAQELNRVLSGGSGPPHLSYWEPTVSGDAQARILRQRSVFIIGRPLLPVDTDFIVEIMVLKEDKMSLQLELQTLDFHQESLFQDIYGFAQVSAIRPVPPLSVEAYQRRGNRYYQRAEYSEAIAAYDKSIELAPNVGLPYLLRGNVLAAQKRHEEAIKNYDNAITHVSQLHPTVRDTVFFNRGNSKVELLDLEGAFQDYTEAINRNPNLSQAYFNRGNTHFDLYRFEEALRDYNLATTLSSQDADFNKGNALLALGRLTEAQNAYQDAISKGVTHAGVSQNLCTLKQILLVLNNLNYDVMAEPDPHTGTSCLRFTVSQDTIGQGESLERFLFFGREGNIGNTGGPGLSGGRGFLGKPIVRVYENIRA